jgi:hypothetical protein
MLLPSYLAQVTGSGPRNNVGAYDHERYDYGWHPYITNRDIAENYAGIWRSRCKGLTSIRLGLQCSLRITNAGEWGWAAVMFL